jgi:hypothetical protein
MKILKTLAGSILAASVVVSPIAFAQGKKSAHMDEFMKSHDMDKDGMMSKAEMHKHMETMFDNADTKKTGKLTKDQTATFLKSAQRDKNFEHEMVQSDGVNHPREMAGKKPMAMKKAAPATQKDKDLEHEMLQSDGANHPRETVGAAKRPTIAKKATPATQKDKDLEHEILQSDGVNHPREVIKK